MSQDPHAVCPCPADLAARLRRVRERRTHDDAADAGSREHREVTLLEAGRGGHGVRQDVDLEGSIVDPRTLREDRELALACRVTRTTREVDRAGGDDGRGASADGLGEVTARVELRRVVAEIRMVMRVPQPWHHQQV